MLPSTINDRRRALSTLGAADPLSKANGQLEAPISPIGLCIESMNCAQSFAPGQHGTGSTGRMTTSLRVEQVDRDVQQAWRLWLELAEGTPAQVDDAACDVWPAVGHLGHH